MILEFSSSKCYLKTLDSSSHLRNHQLYRQSQRQHPNIWHLEQFTTFNSLLIPYINHHAISLHHRNLCCNCCCHAPRSGEACKIASSSVHTSDRLTSVWCWQEMNNAMTTSSSMTTPMSMPMKRTAEPSSQATPTPTSSMSPMRGAKLMMPYESHDQAF